MFAHPEKKNLLTSVILTFVLYNPNFDYYFYYTILYELSDNYVTYSSMKIDLFKPNIYINVLTGEKNDSMITEDFIRFLINIFFTIFCLKEFLKEISHSVNKQDRPSVLLTLMQTKYIIELSIIVLYFTRYTLKNFYSITIKDLRSLLVFKDSQYKNSFFTKQIYMEFFNLKDFYNTDKLYDIFLFFISYVRIIGYFVYNPKMKGFLNFIFDALVRIAYFMVLYLIVLVFLCVFSNNLFGLEVETFKDFMSSFSYILLFCNGHNNLIKSRNNFSAWEMVFIFMIFIMIVFFLNSIFVGIYLESFRLVSWKTGYAKQKKDRKGIFEKLIHLLAKKKNKNNNNNKKGIDKVINNDIEINNIEMHEKR